jgi:outer membrane protein OmpA-like peptidoglycan-associated protein
MMGKRALRVFFHFNAPPCPFYLLSDSIGELMMKQSIFNLAFIISLMMLSLFASANCQQADNLFKQAQQQTDPRQKIGLLKQATGLCSNHKEAHYQLARLQTQAQRWAEAEWLYKRVIELDSNDAPAYAGLGDVLMERKNYHQAAKMFDRFLTLAANKPTSQPQQIYQERLKKAEDQMLTSSTDSMMASLAPLKSSPRKPEIDIPMRFQSGSDEIRKDGITWQQCQKIADSIKRLFDMKGHEKTHIRLEGHTSDEQSNRYSDLLSNRRAQSVKEVLVNEFEVPERRLEVIGMGENDPIVSNDSQHGRFLNNRITLIRIDR